MAKASAETIAALESVLNKAVLGLPNVTSKKMFGCQAYWVNDNVFALVWKEGRLGFKLPDENSYESLIKLTGSVPWSAGPMKMAHWVLVPIGFHTKAAELKNWAKTAHDECATLEKKLSKKKAAKKVAKTGSKANVRKSKD